MTATASRGRSGATPGAAARVNAAGRSSRSRSRVRSAVSRCSSGARTCSSTSSSAGSDCRREIAHRSANRPRTSSSPASRVGSSEGRRVPRIAATEHRPDRRRIEVVAEEVGADRVLARLPKRLDRHRSRDRVHRRRPARSRWRAVRSEAAERPRSPATLAVTKQRAHPARELGPRRPTPSSCSRAR